MSAIPLRVMVLDTWEEIPVVALSTTPVSELKARALEAARVARAPEDYLVKFRGAEVPEGETTVADAGLVPNGALIVLPRRRVPAR
jgi:hypothetical protein